MYATVKQTGGNKVHGFVGGGWRQKTKDKRQKTKDKRQKTKDKSQKSECLKIARL